MSLVGDFKLYNNFYTTLHDKVLFHEHLIIPKKFQLGDIKTDQDLRKLLIIVK